MANSDKHTREKKAGEKEGQVGRSEITGRVAEDICEKVHSDLVSKQIYYKIGFERKKKRSHLPGHE